MLNCELFPHALEAAAYRRTSYQYDLVTLADQVTIGSHRSPTLLFKGDRVEARGQRWIVDRVEHPHPSTMRTLLVCLPA